MAFDLIINIWEWIAGEILGSELVAVGLLLIIISVMFFRINLPKEAILTFLIPSLLAFTFMAYLSWFGWILIGLVGLIFGMLILELYQR